MSSLAELGWAVVRLVLGLSLAWFHGYGKVFGGNIAGFAKAVGAMGFPAPTLFAWAAALAEFAGGILVAIGLLTRPAAGLAGFTMLVAIYRHRSDPLAKAELAIVYAAFMLAAVLIGGGRYSLDALIFRRGRR